MRCDGSVQHRGRSGRKIARGMVSAAVGGEERLCRDAAESAVRSAFVTGLHRGSLVAAGTALAAALVALVFLPARAGGGEDLALVRTEAAGTLPSMTRSSA